MKVRTILGSSVLLILGACASNMERAASSAPADPATPSARAVSDSERAQQRRNILSAPITRPQPVVMRDR